MHIEGVQPLFQRFPSGVVKTTTPIASENKSDNHTLLQEKLNCHLYLGG